jgi:hypothetical protein
MNKLEEPASDQQLACLHQYGFHSTEPLTKGKAAEIIHSFRERSALRAEAERGGVSLAARDEALELRFAVARARSALVAAVAAEEFQCRTLLANTIATRQEFWIDTCREVGRMHRVTKSVLEFYQRHGCRFIPPTHEQVQEVFDALDSAMSSWDRDHPEIFYQTLELNFPSLVRHM